MYSLIWVCLLGTTHANSEPDYDDQMLGEDLTTGQGYNPGSVDGNQGYNPGNTDGNQGYNPGYPDSNQGFNPGHQSYLPLDPSNQGYNPGSQNYLPLEPGNQGYNPGYPNYLPLEQNNQGFNPGHQNYLPLDPSQQGYNPGDPNFLQLDPNQQGYNPGHSNPLPLDPVQQGYNPGDSSGQCGMVDQCCGMAQEGCCVDGQQCYTYYEQVCENVNEPICNKKLRNICHDAVVPDCRVVRTRGSLVVEQLVCMPKPKRQVFEYNVTVCDRSHTNTKYKVVTWENQELKEVNSTFKSEVKNITSCSFTFENETVIEKVPKRERIDEVVEKEVCRQVPRTNYQVMEQVVQVLKYVPECQMVNQQVCSQSSCQQSGCTDGGSSCSSTEFNPEPQTLCAQGQVTGNPSGCQQVQQPICYGQNQPCYQQQGQQCCSQAPQQVCRQIPRRVPVRRNVTVPQVSWEKECQTVNQTIPRYEVTYVNKTVTKSRRICNKVYNEETFNYTMPNYEVVMKNRSEKVPFIMNECKMRVETKQYTHTFPNADFECINKPVNRQYLLNKVVCDRQRPVRFCRGIPESDCQNVNNQRCRMEPREVCQPGCSKSQTCNQCDSFSKQGGFSSCSSPSCPNYYPNTYIGDQGGQGYNPGYGWGQGGYNPGNTGGQNFNPGQTGGQGFNPGQTGGQDFNPGQTGGQGFNPGQTGGQGFHPGHSGGQHYNPGHTGGQHYNPGHTGGQDYNPGQTGGQGFNPGSSGGQGFNSGSLGSPVIDIGLGQVNEPQNTLTEEKEEDNLL